MSSDYTKDMTVGEPWKLISAFAVPVFLSQLFQQLYNTADSLIVGKFLDTEALAAVSSSGPLIFLMVSFFTGMSMGAGVVISRYFGSGDHARVRRAVHTTIALAIVCGLLLTAAGVVFTPVFLRWMDTDPDVLPDAISYFRWYFLGSLPVVMYNSLKGILNALGDSRRPLFYLIISSVMNILLDLLFIGFFRWGVWAAAVATVISQTASMILCLAALTVKDTFYRISPKELRFDREMLGEIIRYGLPSGIQNSVIGFANVIVQSNINTFGKVATAAFGSYSKIEGFAFLPITSFSMALTTFIGQNLGAGKYDRAKIGSRFGIITAILLAETIGVLIYIFAPYLIGMFDSSPEVISYGVSQARIEALFYFLLAFSHAVAAVCRGAGKAFVPMFIMLSIWCVLRIAYITVMMNLDHRIELIFWAYPLTWSISSVIYFLYYRFSDWLHGFSKHPRAAAAR